MNVIREIEQLLKEIYPDKGGEAFARVSSVLEKTKKRPSQNVERFSHRDAVLITYGNSLLLPKSAPLKVLHAFVTQHLKGCFSAVHLLPFFPYSSDDGFSVIDFMAVDPALGGWEDVAQLGQAFDLMFDFVLNHVSAQSEWFENYLDGAPGFADLAIETDPDVDLSGVTRPRALPLLTPFVKGSGRKVHLWTTFSADQIDLNYKSIDVLVRMIEVLLFYVERRARFIRMDAVAYLWKSIGTSCIHLPRTHAMVRLFRKILDFVAPDVAIITETNVPHEENVSYLGDGGNEAQLVYNFSLPPLLIYTFLVEDCLMLSQWARGLALPSGGTTFFNFTASHDGIGVRPLEGILPDDEIERLVRLAINNGGRVSYKDNPDGSKSPYELNLTYVDAFALPGQSGTPLHAARFLASQAIQLALPGIPGVYIHSLLGSRNWYAGLSQTGRPRTINRQKLNIDNVLREIEDKGSFRGRIFHPYCAMLRTRLRQPAFHPAARWEILPLHRKVFGIKRVTPDQTILALTNIAAARTGLSIGPYGLGPEVQDLLSSKRFDTDTIEIAPFETLWLVRPGGGF